MIRSPPRSTLFPYRPLFRSRLYTRRAISGRGCLREWQRRGRVAQPVPPGPVHAKVRSEEHTSELQSQSNLVCRLLLEKKTNSVTSLEQHQITSMIPLPASIA